MASIHRRGKSLNDAEKKPKLSKTQKPALLGVQNNKSPKEYDPKKDQFEIRRRTRTMDGTYQTKNLAKSMPSTPTSEEKSSLISSTGKLFGRRSQSSRSMGDSPTEENQNFSDELGPAGEALGGLVRWVLRLEKVYQRKQGKNEFEACRARIRESLRDLKSFLKLQHLQTEESGKKMAEWIDRAETAEKREQACRQESRDIIENTKAKAKSIMGEMMEKVKLEMSERKSLERAMKEQQVELEKVRSKAALVNALGEDQDIHQLLKELRELRVQNEKLQSQNSQLAADADELRAEARLRKTQAMEAAQKTMPSVGDRQSSAGTAELEEIQILAQSSQEAVAALKRRMKRVTRLSEKYKRRLNDLWEEYQCQWFALHRSRNGRRALRLELKTRDQRLAEMGKRLKLLGGDTLSEFDEEETDSEKTNSPERLKKVLERKSSMVTVDEEASEKEPELPPPIFLDWYGHHFETEIQHIRTQLLKVEMMRYTPEELQSLTLLELFWNKTEAEFWETISDASFYSARAGDEDGHLLNNNQNITRTQNGLKSNIKSKAGIGKGRWAHVSPLHTSNNPSLPALDAVVAEEHEQQAPALPALAAGVGGSAKTHWQRPSLGPSEISFASSFLSTDSRSLRPWEEIQARMRLLRRQSLISKRTPGSLERSMGALEQKQPKFQSLRLSMNSRNNSGSFTSRNSFKASSPSVAALSKASSGRLLHPTFSHQQMTVPTMGGGFEFAKRRPSLPQCVEDLVAHQMSPVENDDLDSSIPSATTSNTEELSLSGKEWMDKMEQLRVEAQQNLIEDVSESQPQHSRDGSWWERMSTLFLAKEAGLQGAQSPIVTTNGMVLGQSGSPSSLSQRTSHHMLDSDEFSFASLDSEAHQDILRRGGTEAESLLRKIKQTEARLSAAVAVLSKTEMQSIH